MVLHLLIGLIMILVQVEHQVHPNLIPEELQQEEQAEVAGVPDNLVLHLREQEVTGAMVVYQELRELALTMQVEEEADMGNREQAVIL